MTNAKLNNMKNNLEENEAQIEILIMKEKMKEIIRNNIIEEIRGQHKRSMNKKKIMDKIISTKISQETTINI